MARQFKISRVLSDPDLAEFHALLLDRKATIDAACAWLRSRRYEVCRSAVGGYVREFRHRNALLARDLAIGSVRAARQKIATAAAELSSELVIALACYAAVLLVNERLRREARRHLARAPPAVRRGRRSPRSSGR